MEPKRLVLTRRPGQSLVIDGPARVTIEKKNRVVVEAAAEVRVLRGELRDKPAEPGERAE